MWSEIGKLIFRSRKDKGLTQAKLASKIRVSSQFLGNIEKGKVPFPKERVRVLIRVLGVTPKNVKKAMLKDYSKKLEHILYR